MSEHLLDDLHISTGGDGETRGGVPELVRMQIWHSDRARRRGERRTERGDAQRLTVPDAGEDQVVGRPALDVVGELGREKPRDRYLPSLMGLRGAPDQTHPLDRRDRLRDHGSMPHHVESADTQRGHLAEADPGVGQEEHDESVGLIRPGVEATVLARINGVAGHGGEIVDLVVGEVAVLVLVRSRQVHAARDVARQSAVFDRHVENQAEYAVDLVDGGR